MEAKRATFDSINNAQLNLIFNVILKAENNNDTISPQSRQDFFSLFAYALVGKGLDYPFKFTYKDNFYDLGSLSIMARHIAFFTDNNPELVLKGKKIRVPIKVLWKALRECMYKPMDEALTLGLRSSAEIIGGTGGSHAFNPEHQAKGDENQAGD